LRHFEEEEQVLLPLYGRHVDLEQDLAGTRPRRPRDAGRSRLAAR
jgi:hypothetical protein